MLINFLVLALFVLKKSFYKASIYRFNWSINAFNVSKTSYFYINSKHFIFTSIKFNFYLNKYIKKSFIKSNVLIKVLRKWVFSISLVLKSLIFTKTTRHKMLCLFYHYRYLNNTNFKNLFCIDFIIYRIRIKSNIKLIFNITQKR